MPIREASATLACREPVCHTSAKAVNAARPDPIKKHAAVQELAAIVVMNNVVTPTLIGYFPAVVMTLFIFFFIFIGSLVFIEPPTFPLVALKKVYTFCSSFDANSQLIDSTCCSLVSPLCNCKIFRHLSGRPWVECSGRTTCVSLKNTREISEFTNIPENKGKISELLNSPTRPITLSTTSRFQKI